MKNEELRMKNFCSMKNEELRMKNRLNEVLIMKNFVYPLYMWQAPFFILCPSSFIYLVFEVAEPGRNHSYAMLVASLQ